MNANVELDQLAMASDARQGDVALLKVYDLLGRFVSYPSEHARVAHTLWIAHTHLMDEWESTPRIAFLSPEPGSGKSRALEITEMLVPNPVSAINVSPAYLFRKIGQDGGTTILYDEIDTVFGPKARENEEIRGLLNAGHRRGQMTGRCVVKGKEIVTEETEAYSAVALAGLGWLPDTILTRSVIIRMRKRRADEKVEPFRRRVHLPDGVKVRTALEIWAGSVAGHIEWPALPPEIIDRDADVWEALIAVADKAGGSWPARARVAAVSLVLESKDQETSLGVRLLQDIKLAFEDRTEITTNKLIGALITLPEAPWSDMKGKPLDARGLSRRLGQYGIKPITFRQGDETPRGYRRADFEDAWARYLPAPGKTAETPPDPDGWSFQLEEQAQWLA